MKRPKGQGAGHRCDDRLPKADGNVEQRRDATKAIIQKEYGPPDVLELGDIERPEIGDGEVLVRVRAAVLLEEKLEPLRYVQSDSHGISIRII